MITQDMERQNIDAEIAGLEQRIRELKEKRNTLAPISVLSNGLICRVFMESLTPGSWRRQRAITHVCRAWRATALHYPQLWSNIDADFQHFWMNTFLSRSKDAFISMRISEDWDDQFRGKDLESLTSILRENQRLEKVEIETKPDEFEKFAEALTEKMPNLTHLTLSNFTHGRSVSFALPAPFLGDHAPRLRELALRNYEPPWASPIWSALTALHLYNNEKYYPIPSPSSEIFFNALGQMHDLQHLVILNLLPDPKPSDPFPPALMFPSLETLRLQGTCKECNWVIRHVQIPHSAAVSLDVSDIDESGLKDIFEVLASSWYDGPLTKVEKEFRWGVVDYTSLSSVSISLKIDYENAVARVELKLSLQTGNEWTSSLRNIVIGSLSTALQSLKSISINTNYDIKSPHVVLKEIIARLPSATWLSVSYATVPPLFVALTEGLQEGEIGETAERSSPTLYLPRLAGIRIGQVRFVHDPAELRGFRKPFLSDHLRRWLAFRKASGARIRQLEIWGCYDVPLSELQEYIGADAHLWLDGEKTNAQSSA